jgi:hypothetical protein
MNVRGPEAGDFIISESGSFWLAEDAEITLDEKATRANLTIDARGAIELKLEKDEWKWGNPDNLVAPTRLRKFVVVGRLGSSGKYVRLERAFAKSFNRFGASVIGAFICVVSDDEGLAVTIQPLAEVIRLPLGSLRAWLDLPFPETAPVEGGFDVHYPAEPDFEYLLALGRLVITSSTTANADFAARTLTVAQQASMEFSLVQGMSIEKVTELYSDIEDLLVLLTDQEVALDWPIIKLSESSASATLYCTRRSQKAAIFSRIDCWLLFSQIVGNFGNIVDKWLELRDELGPAFHLYLGTRRGVDLYEEHRFVNLIWGLESLHRRIHGDSVSPRAQAKVARILASVGELNRRDRGWLEDRLLRAVEPSLSERIDALLSDLPLRVAPGRVTAFAGKCSKLRNDVSHRGGPHLRSEYAEFVLSIHVLSDALDPLYHAAILLRLGITSEQIEHIFFAAFRSFVIRSQLQLAGLHPTVNSPVP